jgi:beta-xylosidase
MWLVVILLLFGSGQALNYSNPIVQEDAVDLGDPGALFVKGFYYLATSSGDVPDAFPIHRSSDLVSWTLVGHVFPSTFS